MGTHPAQLTTGRIVLLNGTPSSGKSTIARALHELLDEAYYYRSLDEFRKGYLDRYWLTDDGTLFLRVLQGYLLSLRDLASLGHNIIAEAVVTPERLEMYLALFTDFTVIFVGVRCPLAEARRRERTRQDRLKGSVEITEPMLDLVHDHGLYDLEVDTGSSTPTAAAQRIKEALATPPHPTAFERLRGQRRRA